jgi:phenylalanyl-tRNA synthetase beta chain
MKISYRWLAQYIDLPEGPEEIGKRLTATGLEVESIEPFERIRGGLRGLIVGEVLTCQKHPNADKLSLTTVDIGAGAPVQIVCGANNVAAGQKVVVAKVGTKIYPVSGEPFTINAAKIRGERSEGMICAEDEIGLGQNHAGIIVLAPAALVGSPVATLYGLETDTIFEIGLTPNRADAASHLGVARDLRAVKKVPLRWPSVEDFRVDSTDLSIPVTVENTEACLRYSAVTLSGISVQDSPDWLKQRLQSIGLTPINNIVDVTNFVLHETGQPLHAFDADEITGHRVIVKTLPEGTLFKTLDNKDRKLSNNDLMICNASEGMCLAGIFGGAKSGISAKTKNIFLESACFSSAYIRRSGLRHQLKTDASFRFERGTDPELTVYALKRAAVLIRELSGGQVSSAIVDVYPNKVQPRAIRVSDRNVARLIGKAIPRDQIFSILEHLDILVTESNDEHFTVSVPPYRVDVLQEADIVEEILRIYGFNNVALSEVAGTSYLSAFPEKDINKFKKEIAGLLASNGFQEILTNSLTNEAYLQRHDVSFPGKPIAILNKLAEDQGVLRQTMLFTGLEVCAHNLNRRQKDLALFEFGKVYWKTEKEGEKNLLRRYHEEERLALYMTGHAEAENWQRKPRSVSYFDLAQHVSDILQRCAVKNSKQESFHDAVFEFGTRILHGKAEIGRAGKIKSAFGKDFGIRQEIFYADLDVALLFNLANPKFDVSEVSKFPEVRRDLSLVLNKAVTFAEIRELVLATEKKLIKEVIAFDVYEGDNLPEGKKAYALGFTLQDDNKTLTDDEIDSAMTRLMHAFEQKMGAFIRK